MPKRVQVPETPAMRGPHANGIASCGPHGSGLDSVSRLAHGALAKAV